MKTSILVWVWGEINGNWENNMIRINQKRDRLCRTILGSKEINESKRAGLWEL